jgi:hypothetical protein
LYGDDWEDDEEMPHSSDEGGEFKLPSVTTKLPNKKFETLVDEVEEEQPQTYKAKVKFAVKKTAPAPNAKA